MIGQNVIASEITGNDILSKENQKKNELKIGSRDIKTYMPAILMDGKNLSYQYVDSTYSEIPAGATGIKAKRTRYLTEGAGSYVRSDENGWDITGQFWSEMHTNYYKFAYANTSGFSFTLPSRDYEIQVTYYNPEKKAYKVVAWDERGAQTSPKSIDCGKTETVKFQVSVIKSNLKLFFVPTSNALRPEDSCQHIYVKNIQIKTLPERKKNSTPTIHITGDSTIHSVSSEVYPREGWGQELYRCFDNGKTWYKKEIWTDNKMNSGMEYRTRSFVIRNWAYSGDSTESFWRLGKFDNILQFINPGDYVLIQFGHNDANKYRPGYSVTTAEYKKNLEIFINGCKERGARCILLSPTPRCRFKGNKIISAVPEYKAVEKKVASYTNSIFVDTGKAVEEYMNTMGKTKALSYYMVLKPGEYKNYPNGHNDSSHFNYKGARKAAQIIAVSLKESLKVPKQIKKAITISTDYYKGVTKELEKVSIVKVKSEKKGNNKASAKKKVKIQYKIKWKKQKYAQYYIIYQYVFKTKKYEKLAATKKQSYTFDKGWTKKQISGIKVKAVLGRFDKNRVLQEEQK